MLPNGTVFELNNHNWTVVGPLPGSDPSGFGTPYIVNDAQGQEAVAKLLAKVPGAQRELLIGEFVRAGNYPNVIPVLDEGENGGDWVIVMPRADMSLSGYLAAHPAPLSMNDLLPILRDVADALAGIDGALVHRDLKPPNILYLNGSWCLADFGIARYADEATGTQTHKGRWTPPFGAPEQWRLEHATAATDVYAFGVTAYLLVSGTLPFTGPLEADFHQQHLSATPPPLTGGTRRLRDLITECLAKAAGARPTPAAIVERLKKITDEPTVAGFAKLAEVNAEHVRTQSEALREASMEQEQRRWREELHRSAVDLFAPIANDLLEAIRDNAPSVELLTGPEAQGNLVVAQFRGARLELNKAEPGRASNLPFTVISESVITLTLPNPVRGWGGRSHSLWYCDAHEEGRFAWYELAFMEMAFGGYHPLIEPYAQSASASQGVFSRGITGMQLGWPVEELDRSDLSEFLGRWLGWFADAVAGRLSRPMSVPEKPTGGSYRE